MKFEVATVITRAPDEAFDRMADARDETRWDTRVSRSVLVSDEPVRHGSAFKTVNRGKEYAATIRAHEGPSRLVFDVTGQAIHHRDLRLQLGAAGSALAAVYEMSPKGFLKAIFPVTAPVIRRDLAKQSRSFQAFCES